MEICMKPKIAEKHQFAKRIRKCISVGYQIYKTYLKNATALIANKSGLVQKLFKNYLLFILIKL